MTELFPWQQDNWHNLLNRANQGRLPHALLVTGLQGIGKCQFALALAEALLCSQPKSDGHACGQCEACALIQAESHPDLHLVEPEEPGKAIKIDQIRGLIQQLVSLKSHYEAGYKIAIIHPADAMNTASANSLLKTLEEPPQNTLLILVSSKPSVLPATIRSRCQLIRMQEPSPEASLQWLNSRIADTQRCRALLEMSGNAPLIALQQAEADTDEAYAQMRADWLKLAQGQADPVKTAEQWLKFDQNQPIFWSYQWVAQMIRLKQLAQQAREGAYETELSKLLETISIRQLYGLYDQITEAIKIAHTQANHLMMLEGILLYWSNLPNQKA
ncbi:MAG: DNA polymerase III subunit delta' [Thioalkalispiraceae bacterium]|jgi:DNA polymerase-3 subunit delta'